MVNQQMAGNSLEQTELDPEDERPVQIPIFMGVAPAALLRFRPEQRGNPMRKDVFQMRVNESDRAVFKAVAQRLERDESSSIRLVMAKVAQELGVTPVAANGQKSETSGKAA